MINTFIHFSSSLENHTRFQTEMDEVYTRFQTKTAQKPYPLRTWTGLYNDGLQPMVSGWLVGNLNSNIKA